MAHLYHRGQHKTHVKGFEEKSTFELNYSRIEGLIHKIILPIDSTHRIT